MAQKKSESQVVTMQCWTGVLRRMWVFAIELLRNKEILFNSLNKLTNGSWNNRKLLRIKWWARFIPCSIFIHEVNLIYVFLNATSNCFPRPVSIWKLLVQINEKKMLRFVLLLRLPHRNATTAEQLPGSIWLFSDIIQDKTPQRYPAADEWSTL